MYRSTQLRVGQIVGHVLEADNALLCTWPHQYDDIWTSSLYFQQTPQQQSTPQPVTDFPAYVQEWLDSHVDPDIITANVRHADGDDAVDLLTHHAIAEMGGHAAQYATTAVINLRQRYRHVLAGGWWVSGLDPLNDWQPMDWGQFKPITPRTSWRDPDKVIKYEAPAKQSTRALFLAVTWADGLKIAERYQRGDAYQQRLKETIRKAYPDATRLSHPQTLALSLDQLSRNPLTDCDIDTPVDTHIDKGFWSWWLSGVWPRLLQNLAIG